MIKIDKPSVIFKDHYENCVKDKREPLKTNLKNCYSRIEDATKDYILRAGIGQLFSLDSILPQLSPVKQKELNGVYTVQMVAGPGRGVYNKILISSSICSFCAQRDSKTLDHYLPKSKYPEFSIFPLNLIPCCRDCNSDKREDNTKLEEKQYLHPYYDDISSIRWLESEVLYASSEPPVFKFFVNKDAVGMSETLFKRLEFQFDSLKIDELYSKLAASELSGIEYYLKKHLKGEIEVKSYLNGMADSKLLMNANSWQAAMYRSMVNNEEFSKLNWSI